MRTFQEYLDTVRPEINERIKFIAERSISDPDIIPMLLEGKRMRAGLLLLVFDAASGKEQGKSGALDLACAIELAHSASLILDDMLDEDTERRGQPAVHLAKGHKRAMLSAIDVLSLPYGIAAPYGELYVQMLAETQRGMVSGVIKELFHEPDLPAAELYDAVITQKTGRLFRLAAAWGCLIARFSSHSPTLSDVSNEEIAPIAEYGLRCGKAMQIADDAADLKKIIEGKKIGRPGSELLLLRCASSPSQQLPGIKQLWSRDVQKTISSVLDREIAISRMVISSVDVPYAEYKGILLNAPSEIVDMVLKAR